MNFLEIFLLVNALVIGAVVALAVQHGYAHFHPRPPQEPAKPHSTPSPGVHLSPAMKEHLLDQAKINFEALLNRSAIEFGHELQTTSANLNKELEKLGSQIIDDELKRYHANLDLLRQTAETTISGAQADITNHQDDLKANLAAEIAAEKARLMTQIDTKLADAVMSFLIETLGHNVDLGAQTSYLTALLDEHKDELKKGLAE